LNLLRPQEKAISHVGLREKPYTWTPWRKSGRSGR